MLAIIAISNKQSTRPFHNYINPVGATISYNAVVLSNRFMASPKHPEGGSDSKTLQGYECTSNIPNPHTGHSRTAQADTGVGLDTPLPAQSEILFTVC